MTKGLDSGVRQNDERIVIAASEPQSSYTLSKL